MMNRFNALSMDQVFMFKMIEKPPVGISFNMMKNGIEKCWSAENTSNFNFFVGGTQFFPNLIPY